MPLAPTNLQPESSSHIGRRPCVPLILWAGLILTLCGCADGSANDAARAQQREAERTAVVAGMQATRNANTLGTPIAQGTRTGAIPPALEANANSVTNEPFAPIATAPASGGDSPPIVPVDPSN